MVQSIVIVGAGIIGAATALQLARAGHHVRVISAGGQDATSATFGWINASFYIDEDHHALRAEGIAAWHRLAKAVDVPMTWQGCLCWDMDAAEMTKTYATLLDRDYPVKMLSAAQVSVLEPSLNDPPGAALFFPSEGATHGPAIHHALLRKAQSLGVQVIRNTPVTGIAMQGDRATGVKTAQGFIPAGQVIIAAGTGTAALVETAGCQVPLNRRPAYILRTTSQAPMLRHVLATPMGEIRQEPEGALLMPVAVGHQADASTSLDQTPVAAADGAIARLRSLFAGMETLQWADIIQAERPVPADDLPVIGQLRDGLYVAVMHSGITLGPVVAELIARDLEDKLDNVGAAMLAPYRPHRFAQT